MILTHPEDITTEDAEPSGDKLLYDIIEEKNKMNAAITAILEEMSI
jgi:hypothetical protein